MKENIKHDHMLAHEFALCKIVCPILNRTFFQLDSWILKNFYIILLFVLLAIEER